MNSLCDFHVKFSQKMQTFSEGFFKSPFPVHVIFKYICNEKVEILQASNISLFQKLQHQIFT